MLNHVHRVRASGDIQTPLITHTARWVYEIMSWRTITIVIRGASVG